MNDICKLPNDGKSCIRLRNEAGEFLSLLPCGVDGNGNVNDIDLALPNGKVLYCGVPIELVNIIIDHLGLEEI